MRIAFLFNFTHPSKRMYILVQIVVRATVVNCCLFNLTFFRKPNLPCEGYTLRCSNFALSVHMVTNLVHFTDFWRKLSSFFVYCVGLCMSL